MDKIRAASFPPSTRSAADCYKGLRENMFTYDQLNEADIKSSVTAKTYLAKIVELCHAPKDNLITKNSNA